MVEEKTRCCINDIVESGHGFDPFGKLIDFYDNVLFPITGWRIANHEFYASFAEGTGGDDWM
jgi:hypothetical protein